MPMLAEPQDYEPIINLAPATPGWRVEARAPLADTADVPAPSQVVAWALVQDATAPGGARLDPVFLADGRTWTPDQYRAAYGQRITLRVAQAAT